MIYLDEGSNPSISNFILSKISIKLEINETMRSQNIMQEIETQQDVNALWKAFSVIIIAEVMFMIVCLAGVYFRFLDELAVLIFAGIVGKLINYVLK